VAAVEGDRQMPPAGNGGSAVVLPAAAPLATVPGNNGNNGHELAARVWAEVRDSNDPQRLAGFAEYFKETYYAIEARLRIERIEAENRRAEEARVLCEAEEKQRAEEQKFRAEGRIPVLVGDRDHSETRWLLPGGGEPFCDIAGGPEMVVVPAGAFMMGSPENEPERGPDESPLHQVTFARPFAVGRDAVTRGQYAAFVKAAGLTDNRWSNPGFAQDDSHPVVNVTWQDAKAYAAWLTDVTGQPYRLLSEAEWEYAARAGTTTPFWWGSTITPAQANYNGEYVYAGGGSKGEFRKGTVPVRSFSPNPWGLYNVHGNVWERCEDTEHIDYNGAPIDGSAWILGNTDSGRVVRGGSWYDDPWGLRAAQRNGDSGVVYDVGFRLARTLTA
jgi:formylglycine-generating enzyme required for sulfatase activity